MASEHEVLGARMNANPLRVLVFPCGSEIGLELHRSLQWSKHIRLVGASSVSSNHGKYVYERYVEGLPSVDECDFIDALNDLVIAENIDLIYPAHDSVVLKLAQHETSLACAIIGSPRDTCEICRSKSLTYRVFHKQLRVPQLYVADETIEHFPVFLKPDVGQGSHGVHLAESDAEVRFFRSQQSELLILEYLPGAEFTVDCFTDRKGQLRFIGPRLRARVQNGISVETYPVDRDPFEHMAETINRTLQLRGGWFFQVKQAEDGELALLEIAPRIAGGMALTRNLGVNLPLLSVYDRLGIDVDIRASRHSLTMDRALDNRFKTELTYDHVYVDLDDTLVVDGRVNVVLVAFLYECLNRGVRRHLITRNPGDVPTILKQHRLDSLFDTVIQVQPSQQKADLVMESSAIFIDDSHSERCAVAKKRDIPTFDLDAIESLLDERR
jgi:hypothetical protein